MKEFDMPQRPYLALPISTTYHQRRSGNIGRKSISKPDRCKHRIKRYEPNLFWLTKWADPKSKQPIRYL